MKKYRIMTDNSGMVFYPQKYIGAFMWAPMQDHAKRELQFMSWEKAQDFIYSEHDRQRKPLKPPKKKFHLVKALELEN